MVMDAAPSALDRTRVVRAVGWSAVDILYRNGFRFLVVVVLARILSPEDFGIVAMLAIFTGVASVFIDGGFGQALIQRQNATLTDESSIFFFNLLMGAAFSLLLGAAASWIADFYKQPVLREITVFMALNLFINTMGSIHMTLLTKKLDFRTIAKVGAIATTLSCILAIAAAVSGLGVWSLVVQAISSSLLSVILLWSLHAWRPAWVFSFRSIRSYFGFSGYLMLSSLMHRVQTHVYALAIGRFYSAQDVGLFVLAQRLQQLPVALLTSIVSRVAFPVFASSIENKAKLARGLSKALGATVFMSAPVSVILFMLSEPLVLTLFGEKWRGSAPVLQALSIPALLMPVQMLNISLLKALGRADLNVRVMAIKFAIGLILLAAALPFGIVAIAWAFASSSIINLFVNGHYSKVFLGYGILRQLGDLSPYLGASVPMVVVMMATDNAFALSGLTEIAVSLATGGMAYLLTCRLARVGALEYLPELFRGKSL